MMNIRNASSLVVLVSVIGLAACGLDPLAHDAKIVHVFPAAVTLIVAFDGPHVRDQEIVPHFDSKRISFRTICTDAANSLAVLSFECKVVD